MMSLATSFENRGAAPNAAEAARWLLRRQAELGITRVADLTGLDVIGIPVVQAIRPGSLANAVSQGKGIRLEEAVVSAVMEAAEQCFAERLDRYRPIRASARQLGIGPETFREYVMPHARADWADTETAWVEAVDLIGGRPAYLPLELVHTAYVDPPVATDGLFIGSTTGLACAFDEAAASLHALCECIEKDAIAHALETHGFFQRRRIDLATIADPVVEALIGKIREAGLALALWSAPAAGGMPVVWCQIMEDGTRPPIMPYAADGFAAAADPARAARAAILEAAQSRLAAISGARDDMTRAVYDDGGDPALLAAHRRLLAAGAGSITFDALSEDAEQEGTPEFDRVLARLCDAGIGSVLRVRLDSEPCPEIVACRIVVPSLRPWQEA